MLSFITLLLYISFLNMLLIGNNNFKKNSNILSSSLKIVDVTGVTDIIIKKPKRVKLCHFKCNCFYSHDVKNDNICVPNPIRPIGFYKNDNICVPNPIRPIGYF
jgi:hypothetical protein